MAKSAPHDDDSDETGTANDLSSVKRRARASSAPESSESTDSSEPSVGDTSTPADGGEFSLTINAAMLRKAGIAAGALIVVALLAIGGWQWYSARQQIRAFGEVKSAASTFIVTSIEYTSSDKVDKAKEAQGPLVTGKMREELSQDRAAETKAVRDQGIKATAKVDSAAVESISGNEATALMIVTATGTSNLSPTPQKRTVALRLNLRREGGKWLGAEAKGVGDFSPTGSTPAPGAPAPTPN